MILAGLVLYFTSTKCTRKKERKRALLVSQQHQCSFCQFCDAAKVERSWEEEEDLAKFENKKNLKISFSIFLATYKES
jgi:hypothetical protein